VDLDRIQPDRERVVVGEDGYLDGGEAGKGGVGGGETVHGYNIRLLIFWVMKLIRRCTGLSFKLDEARHLAHVGCPEECFGLQGKILGPVEES